jgi:XRE family transcriptional regulator, regulator of sulfur utilization
MINTTSTDLPTIGDVILAWRKFRGLRSTELVKLAGIKHKGYLSSIEHNKRVNPKPEYLEKLAEALEVPLQDIYGRRMPPQNSVVSTTPSAAQPAVVRPTQKAASALHFPQPRRMERERVIQKLLGVLKRAEKYEEAWHETLGLLESFVEWLMFRLEELPKPGVLVEQDQELTFSEKLYVLITGPASEVQSFFDEVGAGNMPEFEVARLPQEHKSMFARHTSGYEAKLQGVVVFTSNMKDKPAHDYVKRLIETKFPQSRIEVKISEDIENL